MKNQINTLIDQLSNNLNQLAEKTNKSLKEDDDAVNNFGLIIKDLRNINRKIEQSIVDLDRQSLVLTADEQKRVDEDEVQDRILDRVKPFLLLSQMIEWDYDV